MPAERSRGGGAAAQPPSAGAEAAPSGLRLVIPGEPGAVRDALALLIGSEPFRSLTDDARGTAELVLAEALNNIVEHAYAGAAGPIEITVEAGQGWLDCRIEDGGLPMPGGQLPEGSLPAPDPMDPPEGGFGWHLIRTLSLNLAYARTEGRNRLTFRLATS